MSTPKVVVPSIVETQTYLFSLLIRMKAVILALFAVLGLSFAAPEVLDDSTFGDAIATGETYFVKVCWVYPGKATY